MFDSRHDDDAEVQPVPGVPQEGEGAQTETPGQDLYEGLKRIDTCEGVPGMERSKNEGYVGVEESRRTSESKQKKKGRISREGMEAGTGSGNIYKSSRRTSFTYSFCPQKQV